MAKNASIGQMRTRITIVTQTRGIDEDGFNAQTSAPLFGGQKLWCKWVYAHGNEVFENARLNLEETATVTLWYTPEINTRCKVLREDDADAWEIVSVNVIEDARKMMELYLKRKVKA